MINKFDCTRYQPFEPINMTSRTWPDKTIDKTPIWCSVDLRDGNQALVEPMSVANKTKLFRLLVDIGFKQIEVGFPAASKADFDFTRLIIENDLIPDDVTIQVLTQARQDIIQRTFKAVESAKNVIVHCYNSTSKIQRETVFQKDRSEIIKIATDAAKQIVDLSLLYPDTEWRFQYAPESFSATEIDFSVEICSKVSDVWLPTVDKPMHVALPATVEMSTPNTYADQIEWFCNHISRRDSIIVSTQTHNDRGCAVAASELALMAGAQRVEGTLLGNGERTGNMDIITMAMNMYSQGVDPGLDSSNIDQVTRTVTECIQMDVPPRHPYCGEFVFTAFSGGHQDAINKCMSKTPEDKWDIAYLPIDPTDIGRSYKDIIHINSQSGKGGVCFAIKLHTGLTLPYWLQIAFSHHIQQFCDESQSEISHEKIWELFQTIYLAPLKTSSLVSLSGDGDVQYLIDFGETNTRISLGSDICLENLSQELN